MLSAILWILNAARYAFFVIFVVAVSFLSLNSVIGYVRDFLVAQNTSIFGISLLVYSGFYRDFSPRYIHDF